MTGHDTHLTISLAKTSFNLGQESIASIAAAGKRPPHAAFQTGMNSDLATLPAGTASETATEAAGATADGRVLSAADEVPTLADGRSQTTVGHGTPRAHSG